MAGSIMADPLRPVGQAHDVALVAHHAPDLETLRLGHLGQRTGVDRVATAAG